MNAMLFAPFFRFKKKQIAANSDKKKNNPEIVVNPHVKL